MKRLGIVLGLGVAFASGYFLGKGRPTVITSEPEIRTVTVPEIRTVTVPEIRTVPSPVPCTPEMISAAPPLAPRILSPQFPYFTNVAGEVKIRWEPTPGAEKYRVIVQNASGKEVQNISTRGNVYYLRNLAGTKALNKYRFHVQGFGRGDLEGPPSKSYEVVVRGETKLMAPKIKTIQVED